MQVGPTLETEVPDEAESQDGTITEAEWHSVLDDKTSALLYLNHVERIGGLVVAPSRTLKFIIDEQDWVVPVIALLAVVAMEITRLMGYSALNSAHDVRTFLRDAPYPMFIFMALQEAVPWTIQSAAATGVARFAGSERAFLTGLVAIGYARMPRLFLQTIVTMLSLFGAAGERAGIGFAAGLGAIIPQVNHPHEFILKNALSNINLANIWGFVLVALAIEHLAGVDRRRACIITACYSVITMTAQSVYFLILFNMAGVR